MAMVNLNIHRHIFIVYKQCKSIGNYGFSYEI